MKQELEAEYLATFKKTVAMHETFLCRLAAHPVFREDMNLAIFLEYDKELAVRGKNKKERLAGLLSSFQKTGDELLLSNTQKDVDNFFETEKTFLMTYHGHLKAGSELYFLLFIFVQFIWVFGSQLSRQRFFFLFKNN